MPGTVSDAPSVSLSCELPLSGSISRTQANMREVANNFWGKDDAGVSPLLDRMHHAKTTSDELKSFYNGSSTVHSCWHASNGI